MIKAPWFAVCCLLRSEVEGKVDLYEESIRLVRAWSEEEAITKAEELSKQEQVDYDNVYEEHVVWHFDRVTHVYEVGETVIQDGVEVFLDSYRLKA